MTWPLRGGSSSVSVSLSASASAAYLKWVSAAPLMFGATCALLLILVRDGCAEVEVGFEAARVQARPRVPMGPAWLVVDETTIGDCVRWRGEGSSVDVRGVWSLWQLWDFCGTAVLGGAGGSSSETAVWVGCVSL